MFGFFTRSQELGTGIAGATDDGKPVVTVRIYKDAIGRTRCALTYNGVHIFNNAGPGTKDGDQARERAELIANAQFVIVDETESDNGDS